jgi:cytochrome c5
MLTKRLRNAILGCLAMAVAAAGTLQASKWGRTSPAAASPQSASNSQATGFPPTVQSPVPSPASPQRALLDRYCITCHNERLKTANLMLDKTDLEHVGEGAEVWERVITKLRSGAMPPAGGPRPDKATVDEFISWLETTLDHGANAHPNPGRPAVHRLNRAEYTNAIRDLLALEIDGASLLPADDSGYGFDNIADLLSVSPGLLER